MWLRMQQQSIFLRFINNVLLTFVWKKHQRFFRSLTKSGYFDEFDYFGLLRLNI